VLAAAWLLGCGARTNLDGLAGAGFGGGAATVSNGVGGDGASNGSGPCASLCPAGGCQVVALGSAGQQGVVSIVTDATYVYWIDGFIADPNVIRRAPKSGGAAQTLVPAAHGAVQIAVANGFLYWTELGHYLSSTSDGAVRRVGVAGGPVSTIAEGLYVDEPPLAVDADYVYWIDGGGATVARAPVTGGAPETLASGLQSAFFMTLDSTSVYLSTQGGLWSVPKTGGVLTDVYGTSGDMRDITRQGDDLYFAAFEYGIDHVSTDGGGFQTIAEGTVSPAIASDAQAVYYIVLGSSMQSALYRVCRDGSMPPEQLAAIRGTYAVAVDDSGVYFDNSSSLGKIAK